jgi:hypothetical protein
LGAYRVLTLTGHLGRGSQEVVCCRFPESPRNFHRKCEPRVHWRKREGRGRVDHQRNRGGQVDSDRLRNDD